MFVRLFHIFSMILKLPFPVILTRALHKIGIQTAWTKRWDFIYSHDTKRPNKVIDILNNAIQTCGFSSQILADALKDAKILEVGCGRHVGFATFGLGLGGEKYIGVDPALDTLLLQHPLIHETYFRPAIKAAKAYAEQNDSFKSRPFCLESNSQGLNTFFERCTFITGGIESLSDHHETIDICLSISCLEHILDFDRAARTLAALSQPSTLHIHIVNFSSHINKQEPFSALYHQPYSLFIKRWGPIINGLRLSDMLTRFQSAGLALYAKPIDIRKDALPNRIDSSWSKRYSQDELSVRTALITNMKPVRN